MIQRGAFAGLAQVTTATVYGTVTDASQRAGGASSGALPNPAFVDAMRGLAMGVEQDWPAFEARLAAWYDAVGERSIGWFKRHTQVTLFVFGFLAAMVANINPILISARLWQDEALRKATRPRWPAPRRPKRLPPHRQSPPHRPPRLQRPRRHRACRLRHSRGPRRRCSP